MFEPLNNKALKVAGAAVMVWLLVSSNTPLLTGALCSC